MPGKTIPSDEATEYLRWFIEQTRRIEAAWATGGLAEEINSLRETADAVALEIGWDYDPTSDPDTPFYKETE